MRAKGTKVFLGFLLLSLFLVSFSFAAERYLVATGNWNSTSSWSVSSGGASGASVPIAGDNANIEGGFDVTLTAAAACDNVVIDNNAGVSSIVLSGFTLTVGGTVNVAANGLITMGSGTLTTSGNVSGSGTITLGTGAVLDVNANLTVNTITCAASSTPVIRLTGDFGVTTFTYEQSDVQFDGNAAQDITTSGLAFYDLTVNQGALGTMSTTVSYDVMNTLLLHASNSGTFSPSAGTIHIEGALTHNGGTFTASGSNVIEIPLGGFTISTASGMTFQDITHNPNVGTQTSATLIFSASSGTQTITINGKFTKENRSGNVTLTSINPLSYGSSASLEYNLNQSRNVSNEWPAGAAANNGVPNILLTKGAVTITTGSTHQVRSKLTRGAGSLAISSGTLEYDATPSTTLEYYHSLQQSVGAEWPGSQGPDNLVVNNSYSGAGVAVDLGSTSRTLSGNLTLTDGIVDFTGSNTLTINGNVSGTSIGEFGTTNSRELILNGASSTITSSGYPKFYDITFSSSATSGVINNNFIVNGTLAINASASVTVNGAFTLASGAAITVSGTLDLNTQNIVELGTNTLTVNSGGTLKTGGASITNYSTYSLAGTVEFDGTSGAETLPMPAGGTLTIGTLVVNNASGVATAAGRLDVSSALTLTNGTITTTSANLLRLAETTTVTRTDDTDFVIGPLQKSLNNANLSFVFPVGFGSTYSPATFAYASGLTTSGIVEIAAVSGTPGGTAPTGISTIATSHHYTLQEITTPAGFSNYDLTLTWTGTGFSQNRNQILIQNGAGPVYEYTAAASHTATTVTRTGLTLFPSNDHRAAFGSSSQTIIWTGSANGLWSNTGNWNPAEQPQAGDDVEFSGSYGSTQTVEYDALASASEFASITINPSLGSVELTLNKSALNLTATSNALVVNSGSKLIYGTTSLQMGGGAYNPARTTYNGTVEYTSAAVFIDNYSDLNINGATATSGTGTINVSGTLTKSGADFTTTQSCTTAAYINTSGNANFSGTSLRVTGTTTINGGTVGGTAQVEGNVVFGGTGSAGGAFTFAAGNAQAISGSGADFNNVTIAKSGNNVTLGTPVTIGNGLTLTSGNIITETNLLTFGTGVTDNNVSEGSNVSFIDGPAAKISASTDAFTFPVGDNGRWRRLRIEPNSTSAVTYTAEYYRTNPTVAIGASLNGMNNISIIQYWRLERNAGVNANVRLFWESAAEDGVNGAVSDLRTAQWDQSATEWVDMDGSATDLGGGQGYITAGGITNFGAGADIYFTLGSETGDNSLPVELMAFTASADYGKVNLEWSTASEVNNHGFNIYRSPEGFDNWEKINGQLISGQGNTSMQTDYEYIDSDVMAGRAYSYQLESVSINGVAEVLETVDATIPVPKEYVLFNNYPNPFNPSTHIKFQLPEYQSVKLEVYDMKGRLVTTLLNNTDYEAGEHVVTWNATDNSGKRVASGMYFYRFSAGQFNKLGKMILLK